MKKYIPILLLLIFSLAVYAAEERTSTLSWVPPTEYTDGSSLNQADIEFFNVYYTSDGTPPNSQSNVLHIPNLSFGEPSAPTTTSYVHVLQLEPSPELYTYSYVLTTALGDGRESEFSTVGSKQFLVKSSANPNAPTLVGVE